MNEQPHEQLVEELRRSDPLREVQLVSEGAISADVRHRRAVARALSAGVDQNVAVPPAISHLARDADEDVRGYAIEAAATRLEEAPKRYLELLRRACLDPSRRVRRLALAGLQKAIELGHARGAAPALVRCMSIADPVTQELATGPLLALQQLMVRRAVAAYEEIAARARELPPSVRNILMDNAARLRDSHPQRIARVVAALSDQSTTELARRSSD
jgi:HEAT repeat protein